MTAGELAKILGSLPPDLPVYLRDPDTDWILEPHVEVTETAVTIFSTYHEEDRIS